MAAARTPALPPALRGLLEAGGALVRRSSSGRVALGRAAGVVPEDIVPRAMKRLPAELEAARAAAATPLDAKTVERVLKTAWHAAPRKVLDEFDATSPLAVTTSAQVHRGVHQGAPVAIKVLRPGLAGAVRNDLALLDALAGPLRAVFGELDAGAILREVRETALDELDLEHEASTQRQVRRLLRDVDGLVVPAPVLELCSDDVVVSAFLEGETLAGGAVPGDPAAVARVLVQAHGVAARAGLALTDARPGHVVLLDDGRVGLLGAGLARAVDRGRIQAALRALEALRAEDRDAFVAAVAGELQVLDEAAATKAYGLTGDLAGELVRGPARLDGAALKAAGEAALRRLPELLELAAVLTPAPGDLAAARSLGQAAVVLSRLAATEDWGALVLEAG
ncbi:MAG: hypothetical protein QOF86_4343 [Baekduia sp.]|nr:hypothetical protein [Baekduia sp.]